jgi:hypothetical protein
MLREVLEHDIISDIFLICIQLSAIFCILSTQQGSKQLALFSFKFTLSEISCHLNGKKPPFGFGNAAKGIFPLVASSYKQNVRFFPLQTGGALEVAENRFKGLHTARKLRADTMPHSSGRRACMDQSDLELSSESDSEAGQHWLVRAPPAVQPRGQMMAMPVKLHAQVAAWHLQALIS